VLVGKHEGKRPLERPRRRCEDNIKMDLQEVGGGRGDWRELAQDRDGWRALLSTVKNFRVPLKCGEFLDWLQRLISFSRRTLLHGVSKHKQLTLCTELYHFFIQYTGSYMFRQQSAIIRELLRSVWVTWNAEQISGISYKVCLCGLCGSVCCATNRTTTLVHTGHINLHYMIYHLFVLHFK
jgi:hypothetical protein